MSNIYIEGIKEQLVRHLADGEIEVEELGELGVWCIAAAMGDALKEGLSGLMDALGGDDSTD